MVSRSCSQGALRFRFSRRDPLSASEQGAEQAKAQYRQASHNGGKRTLHTAKLCSLRCVAVPLLRRVNAFHHHCAVDVQPRQPDGEQPFPPGPVERRGVGNG